MAAKYRRIDPRVWRDEKFTRLSSEEKLVALYVITAQSNRIGLFNFSPALAAEDLNMPTETFLERFRKVINALGWAYDFEHRVMFLHTWFKHNPPENGNVFKGCLNDLADIPKTPLIQEFCNVCRNLAETYGVTLPGTIPQTLPNSGTGFKDTGTGLSEGVCAGEIEHEHTSRRGKDSPKPKPPKVNPEDDPLFIRFWAAYPRRENKIRAAKAFAEHKPDEAMLTRMLAAIVIQQRPGGCLEDRTADGRSVVPHPSTWLNNRRWTEADEEVASPATTTPRRATDNPMIRAMLGEGVSNAAS